MESSVLSRGRVRRLISALIRNRSLQLARGEYRNRRYLNLGCGGNTPPEFINLDYEWRPGVDICWDLRRGIPLEADSFEGITTEHTLEHFTWSDAINTFLPECFRVLRSGGAIRIVVPCAEKAVDAYLDAKARGLTEIAFRAPRNGADRIPMTPMLTLNNTFRRIFEPLEVGHKFVYDFQTLEYFLHLVGFVDVTRETFMHGRDPVLLIDTEKRAPESLYVEATKP